MSNKVFKRVAATLLAVLLLFYVGLQIYNSNHSSIQTETATYMTASDTIETTGYEGSYMSFMKAIFLPCLVLGLLALLMLVKPAWFVFLT